MIGLFNIEKTVRDLGASVNLLPYLIYKQVGLGELKLSPVTWQLSDKSKWHPKWVIKDVLMQIDNFYFPMDFIVIDAVPIKTLVFKSHLSLDIYFLPPINAVCYVLLPTYGIQVCTTDANNIFGLNILMPPVEFATTILNNNNLKYKGNSFFYWSKRLEIIDRITEYNKIR